MEVRTSQLTANSQQSLNGMERTCDELVRNPKAVFSQRQVCNKSSNKCINKVVTTLGGDYSIVIIT